MKTFGRPWWPLAVLAALIIAGAAPASGVLPKGGRVVASIRIPRLTTGVLAVGGGAVWTTSDATASLIRIDPKRNSIAARTKVTTHNPCPPFPGSCGEAVVGDGALWIARYSDNSVLRIDPSDGRVVATIAVVAQPEGIAATAGAVWVVNDGGPSVSRIDATTNKVVATIPLGPVSVNSGHMAITAGAGKVWATLPSRKMVVGIDPATNAVMARVHLSGGPCAFLAADARAVWAAGGHCADAVMRIDPRTEKQRGLVRGDAVPLGLALGFGSLWVAYLDSKVIDRVNPHTGKVVARLPVGGNPVRLSVGFGCVWLRDDSGRILRIKPT